MKWIKLSKGLKTLVDNDVYTWTSSVNWYSHESSGKIYAANKNKKMIYLHRKILAVSNSKIQVDHINGNSLDNRRKNLRICTETQNNRNKTIGKNNTSGYKGVSWVKASKKWKAQIGVNLKNISLGNYENILDAVKAYKSASMLYHGEFSNTKRKNKI